MTVFTENRNHAGFLIGGQLCKYICRLCRSCKLCIAHVFQIRTEKHIANLQPHLLTDSVSHFVVITSQNFGGNTVVFQSLNSIRSRFFWRIEECQISNQHHVTLIFNTKCANWGRIAFLCNHQNAKPLVVKIIHCLQNPVTDVISQRLYSSITLCKRTDREHFFHSTFCYHLGLALFILYHSSKTATCEVKRNLVYLYIVFGQVNETRICGFFFLRLMDNCQIHQVFIARLEVTIEISVTQYPSIVLAIYIQVVFQHNLILGQRASLVGAENINSTEVLNRIEVFNDCLLFAHGNSTFRKTGCYNHWQHFRCQTDSNRNAE